MAAIRLTQLILEDRWPGAPNPNLGIPTGGFDATAWNFCTTDATASSQNPPYPIGTKIQTYTDNTNCPGWYTMIYLAFHDYSTQDISEGCITGGKGICSRVDNVGCGTKTTFAGADTTVAPWYFVTRCTTGTSDVTGGQPICFPCCSIEADSSIVLTTDDPRGVGYGHGWAWFWCGGVCPVKDLTFLDNSAGGTGGADISVDTLMRAGPVACCVSSDGVLLVSCDATNLTDATGMVGLIPQGVAWACSSEGD